jgi:hypothetical protein
MNLIERRIFRLEDEIRILNVHLHYDENPDKYCLPKTTEQRQKDIQHLKTIIADRQTELETLKSKETKQTI